MDKYQHSVIFLPVTSIISIGRSGKESWIYIQYGQYLHQCEETIWMVSKKNNMQIEAQNQYNVEELRN